MFTFFIYICLMASFWGVQAGTAFLGCGTAELCCFAMENSHFTKIVAYHIQNVLNFKNINIFQFLFKVIS